MISTEFVAGDRVELRDPPHGPLHGVVVDVTEHAVRVRWDHMWDHHEPAIIGRDGLPRLFREGALPHEASRTSRPL